MSDFTFCLDFSPCAFWIDMFVIVVICFALSNIIFHYFYGRGKPKEKGVKDQGDEDVTELIRAKERTGWGGSPDSGVTCLGLDSGSAAHRLCNRASYSTSLCLSFPIYNTGVVLKVT